MNLTIKPYCNAKAHWVVFGGVEVLFSYETPIALRAGANSCHVANTWGPTTERHFTQCGGRTCGPEVDAVAFNERVKSAIMDWALEQAVNRIEGVPS